MKHIYLILLVFVVLACQESNQEPTKGSHTEIDSIGVQPASDAVKEFANYSTDLQHILKNEEQMFRGINFKFNKEEVRGTESARHTETSDEYILYSLDTLISFEHEIEYQFDTVSNQLTKVSFIGYFKDEKSREIMFDEFQQYFNEYLGIGGQGDDNTIIWSTKEQYQISIEKAGNPKRPDFLLKYDKI